jgi:Flp pilus assembly protein TadD
MDRELIKEALEHFTAGRLPDAHNICQTILVKQPNHAGALQILGLILSARMQYNIAIDLMRRSIAAAPDVPDFHNNLGESLFYAGRVKEAAVCYRTAIRLNPKMWAAYSNLGRCMMFFDKPAEAQAAYRKVIELNPELPQAYLHLATLVLREGKGDEAIALLEKAVELKPDYVNAAGALGGLLSTKGDFDRALEYHNRVLKLAPNNPSAHINKALVLMLQGKYEQAWEDYEWRWKLPGLQERELGRPRWNGEDIAGKTILVHAEQGFGDTIQFLRYVPMVAERAAKVIVECQESLKVLAQSVEGSAAVVTRGEALGEFDVHAPMASLPGIFKTTVRTIPARIPYLHVPADRLEKWKQKIAGEKRFKVGLVWAGSPTNANDRNRTVGLGLMSEIARVKGAAFYGLQKGEAVKQLEEYKDLGIVDLSQELNDFADTAAALEQMDLLISVDTSVVHLAGAIGKATWVILHYSPPWRWHLQGEDSPWYPSLRLFRQSKAMKWEEPIARVVEALGERVKSTPM